MWFCEDAVLHKTQIYIRLEIERALIVNGFYPGADDFIRSENMTDNLPIKTRTEGYILEVTLDRPKANAIDLATSRLMGETFTMVTLSMVTMALAALVVYKSWATLISR